jgi:aryl-alcohol dehydrogenase-like predicted oxidoreductase
MKALGISAQQHLSRFVSLQAYYTLAGRDLERELVPLLLDQKLGLMVWSPLAGGLLSGKYSRHASTEEGRRVNYDFPPVDKEKAFDIIDVMQEIATEKGATVAQIALAWLLHQQVVTSVIIGVKKPEQLQDNLKSVDIKLTAEELAKLDEVSKLAPEYPGWMLDRQGGDRKA